MTVAAKKLPSLIIGIKRRIHRRNDAKAAQADREYRALRKPAMEKAGYRCMYCGFKSEKYNQIHHQNDDHTDNSPENLTCICALCHPYHHVGEPSKNGQSSGLEEGHLGNVARLIRVPDAEAIPAQDFNHLLRAIAIALSDPDEAEDAKKVFSLLANPDNLRDMSAAYASDKPADMAAAFSRLTDDEYNQREQVVAPIRILYPQSMLVSLGRGWKKEHGGGMSKPSNWESMLPKPLALIARDDESEKNNPGPSVGLDDIDDDDEEDEFDD